MRQGIYYPETDLTFWGNSLESYFNSAGLFVLLVGVFWIFQRLLLVRFEKLSQKTNTGIDDQIVKIIRSIKPPFYVSLAFLISLNTLDFTGLGAKIITTLIITLITYQSVLSVAVLVDYIAKGLKKKRESTGEKEAIETLGKISKGILWVVGVLVILQNLGVEVTSLIAGLGIGGVAIAFALQNILGDLFSSFAIIFDKPFEPGDFIVTGEHMGVVEDIGIKTTRIRALQGEELVISNNDLTSARIQNFKKLKERRVTFTFGVLYETDVKKIKRIPGYIEKIITSVGKTRFDRAHFMEFGDSALNFEIVYFVESSDYNEYMDIQQEILIKVKDKFDEENIEIAYPTRTVYVSK